ncbi:MAG: hypothetical protein HYS98_06505 [Deltaproteobacteria bacterium]|nr:hypothetical protein [Deltaproteobacteria bacterium]
MVSTICAKEWGPEYLKFNLPDSWHCETSESEYTCFPKDKKKDALIVTAIKIQDAQKDTLEKFYEYLKEQKKIMHPDGRSVASEVHFANYRTINQVKWAYAMHTSSILPDYRTSYLATVYKGLVIAAAFSTSVDKYLVYREAMTEMLKSIRITGKIPTTISTD